MFGWDWCYDNFAKANIDIRWPLHWYTYTGAQYNTVLGSLLFYKQTISVTMLLLMTIAIMGDYLKHGPWPFT
jgi:hypothetical protein